MIARQPKRGSPRPICRFLGLVLFGFGAALGSLAAGECRTRETTWPGGRAIEMENDRLLLRVLPSVYGALGELIVKDGQRSTLLPPLDQSEEIIPGTGIRAKGDSLPGLRDWLWPRLPHPFGREFTATTDGGDAGRAIVRVRAKKDDWEITRTMTLRSGSSMVEVEVAVTYHGNPPEKKSYWSHATLRLGGDFLSMPGDDNDLLVIPARKEASSVQGVIPFPVQMDQLVKHVPAAGQADHFYAPAQPWLAAIDKAKTLLLAMHIAEPAFPSDALYFSWTGPQLGVMIHSLETIFPLREFQRGETHRCRFNLLASTGFDDVDYVSSNAVISLKDPPLAPQVSVKEWPVEGKLATPAAAKPRELLLWFENDRARSNAARVVIQNPGPARPSSFSARMVFKEVPSGRQVLRGRLLDEQGQAIEEFTLLGYAVTFTP